MITGETIGAAYLVDLTSKNAAIFRLSARSGGLVGTKALRRALAIKSSLSHPHDHGRYADAKPFRRLPR